jgi:hypothetical protein
MKVKIISATDDVLVGSKMLLDPASAFFEHSKVLFKVEKVVQKDNVLQIFCSNFYITALILGE